MTGIRKLCNTCNRLSLSCEFCIKYGNKGKLVYLEKSLIKKKSKQIEDDTINNRQLQVYSNLLLRKL